MLLADLNQKYSFEKVEEIVGENLAYFHIQGRLGNQLLGLSDAHLVHKTTGLKVVIDIQEVSEEYEIPEWISYVCELPWAVVLNSKLEDIAKINAQLTDLAKTSSSNDLINRKYFHGFKPSLQYIQESGLFKKGNFSFPFSTKKNKSNFDAAICIRRGDYISNPHLGVLPARYYKRAMKTLGLNSKDSLLEVFTDDVEGAEKFLSQNFSFRYEINLEPSPIKALAELSAHQNIIAANSTYSYWGSFFSNANSVFPSPFYLSQPKWHTDLISAENKVVRHTVFPRVQYVSNLIRAKSSGFFE